MNEQERQESVSLSTSMSSTISTHRLFDAHCHYSFAPDVERFCAQASKNLSGAFSTTVSPQDFLYVASKKGALPSLKIGLGAHPWWISRGLISSQEANKLVELAKEVRFIGEVGLDLGRNGLAESVFATEEETKEAQVGILRALFASCAKNSLPDGRVFSFHAVRGADVILDMLEEFKLLQGNHAIFHWFSGSNPQLRRALDLGVCFSVNQFMLNTRRGREYAKQMPPDRLLVETDLPEEQPHENKLESENDQNVAMLYPSEQTLLGDAFDAQWRSYLLTLEQGYRLLADIRGPEVYSSIEQNVARIFN